MRETKFYFWRYFSLLLFSLSVVSDSLQLHGLQHARIPCPSPSPGACSNSCPLSQWCHPTISFSVALFSSCPQSFPASESFPMSQLFTPGCQSIGTSTSALVLPLNIQDWFLLGLIGLISLLSKGLLRVFSLLWYTKMVTKTKISVMVIFVVERIWLLSECFHNVLNNMQTPFSYFTHSSLCFLLWNNTNNCLLIQYYFLSCSRCLDIVNYSLPLTPKMNNLPVSFKIYHCILHLTPLLALYFYFWVLLLKFALTIS